MRLTERKARQRLAQAIADAGSQAVIPRRLPLSLLRAQSAVSRSVRGQYPVHHLLLEMLGLRRDEAGDIYTVENEERAA